MHVTCSFWFTQRLIEFCIVEKHRNQDFGNWNYFKTLNQINLYFVLQSDSKVVHVVKMVNLVRR